MLTVALSVLTSLGMIVSAQAMMMNQEPWLILVLACLAGLVALNLLWRQAQQFMAEPDPFIHDSRPFSARLAADATTALVGVGVVILSIIQINDMDEPETRWAFLLATILGGPFIALGLGTAWDRWRKRTFRL
jgi:uncharacterized membrane protein YfcA